MVPTKFKEADYPIIATPKASDQQASNAAAKVFAEWLRFVEGASAEWLPATMCWKKASLTAPSGGPRTVLPVSSLRKRERNSKEARQSPSEPYPVRRSRNSFDDGLLSGKRSMLDRSVCSTFVHS